MIAGLLLLAVFWAAAAAQTVAFKMAFGLKGAVPVGVLLAIPLGIVTMARLTV